MTDFIESGNWSDKISNPTQLGGIETSVLDNGLSRGVRIAWVNTGSGLRYKIVLDRAMDIADAFMNPYSLAWLSPTGISQPERFSDKGADWLRTFGGGLMVTCGLSNTGPSGEGYGLHGDISNIPAEIESVTQPDPRRGNLSMSITGKISESTIFGPNLELRRTISGELGKASIHVHDEVMNTGNRTVPHMILYHCNFGWPLVDEGSEIGWKGNWVARDEDSKLIFSEGKDFHRCTGVLEQHTGSGEAAAFIDIDSDADGQCCCSLSNRKLGLDVELRFKKEQLPWLINWQHWGRGEYVTGLEPANCPPIGQKSAMETNRLVYLGPGERKTYDLEFEIKNKQ